jgi:hypothetical protein
MCAEAEAAGAAPGYLFDPTVKCCSYVPALPNFLVGRILSDADPAAAAGRASVEARIGAGVGVTPIGLLPSAIFSRLYEGSAPEAFGRNRAFRCPHYLQESGTCGIWRNRNSLCTTWFCKHVRGQLGQAFWRMLLELLGRAEHELRQWCVLELQPGDEALKSLREWMLAKDELTAAALEERVERKVYQRIWGSWLGCEHEFYVRCAELVEGLTWAEVSAICGPELRLQARLTQSAYARLLSDEIPPVLEPGSIQVSRAAKGTLRVTTYSTHDPLDAPDVVLDLLGEFDGRPTGEVMDAIEAEYGAKPELELIRKLVDFRLLVEPDEPR